MSTTTDEINSNIAVNDDKDSKNAENEESELLSHRDEEVEKPTESDGEKRDNVGDDDVADAEKASSVAAEDEVVLENAEIAVPSIVQRSSVLKKFLELVDTNAFVFVVYYRGIWCRYCRLYLIELKAYMDAIAANGGALLCVTAESEEFVTKAKALWKIPFPIYSDPTNELALYLNDHNLCPVALSFKLKNRYPYGLAQPALLVLRKPEDVLYTWAVKPSMRNVGGAIHRPYIADVWSVVEEKLEAREREREGEEERKVGKVTCLDLCRTKTKDSVYVGKRKCFCGIM